MHEGSIKRMIMCVNKKTHNRNVMRHSNTIIKDWLLKNNYTQIWFKAHTRNHDMIYTQKGNYRAIDLWNLFDGICINQDDNKICFIQAKTNAWAKQKPLAEFAYNYSVTVLSFNVTNKRKECKTKLKNGKTKKTFKVFLREYN